MQNPEIMTQPDGEYVVTYSAEKLELPLLKAKAQPLMRYAYFQFENSSKRELVVRTVEDIDVGKNIHRGIEFAPSDENTRLIDIVSKYKDNRLPIINQTDKGVVLDLHGFLYRIALNSNRKN